MEIREIMTEKKQVLPLRLLADEQESMIDTYLERGTLYAMYDDGREDAVAVCVVTDEGDAAEIKNLAVTPAYQRKGYGRKMIAFVKEQTRGKFSVLMTGTGDSPLTVPFYEACGFVRSHVVKDFFLEHYDHPIYEAGKQLTDMVYLKMELL